MSLNPFRKALLILTLELIVGCSSSSHVVISRDQSISGISINDLVKLSFQQNEPPPGAEPEEPRCGYELMPMVWKLDLARARKEHEIVHCQIPENHYIFLTLISTIHIEMNLGSEACDDLTKGATHDVESLHDPDLWLDDLYITDLSRFRQAIQGCPTPFLKEGNSFAGLRSSADGNFVLIDPMERSKHRFSFSVTNPCWVDLRDDKSGECPAKQSRRAVEMFLIIE